MHSETKVFLNKSPSTKEPFFKTLKPRSGLRLGEPRSGLRLGGKKNFENTLLEWPKPIIYLFQNIRPIPFLPKEPSLDLPFSEAQTSSRF
jgi:hypothetical protein